MGGGNKITVGYKYHLGVHFVLGANPFDLITSIEVDKRIAWTGPAGPGRIEIAARALFGGKRREGGVKGSVDLLDGAADQGPNDYLETAIGTVQPAYRGVSSAVLRQLYIGNNPYLKDWGIRGQFIEAVEPAYNGGTQWYPEAAKILQRRIEDQTRRERTYIAIDCSGSMLTVTGNGETRHTNVKAAVVAFLETKRAALAASRTGSFRIVAWDADVMGSITRENATSADYDALIAFVNAMTTGFDNQLVSAVSLAPDFFAVDVPVIGNTLGGFSTPQSDEARRLLILTDGEAIADAPDAAEDLEVLEAVDVYCFAIDAPNTAWAADIDNTPDDGVPVVSGGDPVALAEALAPGRNEYDMNPVHILRQVVMRRGPGTYIDDTEMVAASWEAAADTIHEEGFGLSLSWATPSKRVEFIERIEAIIDARVFRDRRTGKWDIKLIRDDYDVEDLHVFDSSNVISWEGFERPEPHMVPNEVTLTYTEPSKDAPGTLTLSDPALRIQAGGVIKAKNDYPEINRADLASRVLQRDHLALSGRLREGWIAVTWCPLEITQASTVILDRPRIGLNQMVARVLEIDEGDGRDNTVRLRVVEDKFRLPAVGLSGSGVVTVPEPQVLSPDPRLVEEAPYYELARQQGQEVIDELLLADPDLGFLMASAGRPQANALQALLNVDVGAGYVEEGVVEYAPAVALWSNLSRRADHTRIIVAHSRDLEEVEAGSLAWIGGELVRVDTLTMGGTWDVGDYWAPPVEPTGDVVTIDIGRGCLDTPPEEHFAGDDLICFQDRDLTPDTRYTAGEVAEVKLLNVMPKRTQDLAAALVDELEFDSRAWRPYPPGKVQADGQYHAGDGPAAEWTTGARVFTWAHRNRLTQTTTTLDDHTFGNIGPEGGVTYSVRVVAVDDAGAEMAVLFEQSGITGTTITIDAATDFAEPVPGDHAAVWFEIWSERDEGSS